MLDKTSLAKSILMACIGKRGVWAASDRYPHQNWTRDFALASLPILMRLGQRDIVQTHLRNLSMCQRSNGQIPILFLDKTWPFLVEKIKRTWRDRRLSFMLGRWMQGKLWNLTPGTRDSEILYLLAMYEYARISGDRTMISSPYFSDFSRNIRMALEYVEIHLMRDGLIIGCDWRDTMHEELGDKTLLTNNCILYRVYRLMGEDEKADRLGASIMHTFFVNGAFVDYPGSSRFDPLGGAFAVLYDVVPEEFHPQILAGFGSVDTGCGVTIQCVHNAYVPAEREVFERTNGVVVWPFVVGFTVLALLKIKVDCFV